MFEDFFSGLRFESCRIFLGDRLSTESALHPRKSVDATRRFRPTSDIRVAPVSFSLIWRIETRMSASSHNQQVENVFTATLTIHSQALSPSFRATGPSPRRSSGESCFRTRCIATERGHNLVIHMIFQVSSDVGAKYRLRYA